MEEVTTTGGDASEAMEHLRHFIPQGNWHRAKYLSDVAPHEYIRMREEPRLATDLIWTIRDYGVDEEFTLHNYRKTYRYLYLGEYKYWYMEPFLGNSKLHHDSIVNRARVERD